MIGVTLKYGGKDVSLLKFLEERLTANPSSSLFAMLAYFYLQVDKVGEALSVAQRGVIAHPAYSTGHIVLAMAMMRAELFSDAKKELLKAADLHPGSEILGAISADFESRAQADSIGKKLAGQFRKTSGDPDIMKRVEETLKQNPMKKTDEDAIIPGLDDIVGDELTRVQRQFTESLNRLDSIVPPAKQAEDTPAKQSESEIARAIIDKVTREVEGKEPQEEKHDRPIPEEPPLNEPIGSDFDIDALARELVTAKPISPEIDGIDAGKDDGASIELSPEIVTDTLAKIFEQQGQTKTAIEAYNILIAKKPERADFYRERIAFLTSKTDGSR